MSNTTRPQIIKGKDNLNQGEKNHDGQDDLKKGTIKGLETYITGDLSHMLFLQNKAFADETNDIRQTAIHQFHTDPKCIIRGINIE